MIRGMCRDCTGCLLCQESDGFDSDGYWLETADANDDERNRKEQEQ